MSKSVSVRSSSGLHYRFATSLVAIVIVGVLYACSQLPRLTKSDATRMAARFQFVRYALPELADIPRERYKDIRAVHPSLRRLAAWISFVGAAAALGDLDGDGTSNDLIYVDPRVDEAIVTPVPGTGDRYGVFALRPSGLAYDPATMAPMGSLIGDFNEDGLSDVLVYYWGRSPMIFYRRADSAATDDRLAAGQYTAVDLLQPLQVWFTCAVAQADLDGDGRQDLVIGNYSPDGAAVLDANATEGVEDMMHSFGRAFNGGRNRLLRHVPPATPGAFPEFVEMPDVLEDDVARGWTFGIGVADLDGDLLPEIYFVQDFGPDRLLHNQSQPGSFAFRLLEGRQGWTTPPIQSVGARFFQRHGYRLRRCKRRRLTRFLCQQHLH